MDLLLSVLVPSNWAVADDVLWVGLRKAGKVVLMRYASAKVGDRIAFAPDDCSIQRNLSDVGAKKPSW